MLKTEKLFSTTKRVQEKGKNKNAERGNTLLQEKERGQKRRSKKENRRRSNNGGHLEGASKHFTLQRCEGKLREENEWSPQLLATVHGTGVGVGWVRRKGDNSRG